MKLSPSCQFYIDLHTCSVEEELRLLDVINANIPMRTSVPDWKKAPKYLTAGEVDQRSLKSAVLALYAEMGGNQDDAVCVISINDAFPALKTSMSEWMVYFDGLSFVDTLFLCEFKGIAIHWDFYKVLHGVLYKSL